MAVHPRACGEQRPVPTQSLFNVGSSPRVRGTVQAADDAWQSARFIPARAGNSVTLWCLGSGRAVHPRACGEQYCSARVSTLRPGSSPRVRGTESGLLCFLCPSRFIPARAGNSCEYILKAHNVTVHPRACGEQDDTLAFTLEQTGSSPRVRGTDWRRARHHWLQRFIPARAGNRRAWLMLLAFGSVHPRACGEQSVAALNRDVDPGSSPRVRGTVRRSGGSRR